MLTHALAGAVAIGVGKHTQNLIDNLVRDAGLRSTKELGDILKYKNMKPRELESLLKSLDMDDILGLSEHTMQFLRKETGMTSDAILKELEKGNMSIRGVKPNNIDEVLGELKKGASGADFLSGMNVEDAKRYELWNYLRENGLDQAKLNDIILTNRGFRLSPSEYLSKEYIDAHLSKFENGASFVVTKDAYEDFIEERGLIGFPDNSQFVAPSDAINDIIHTSNGNLEYIEKSLGFDTGYFNNHGGLVQIDVRNLENLNLRLPSGNEMGANKHWLPGGYTDGGTIEAIIDQIPNNSDFVNIKFFK